MFCINCGKQNPQEALFCAFCGTKISVEETVITEVQQEEQAEEKQAEEYQDAVIDKDSILETNNIDDIGSDSTGNSNVYNVSNKENKTRKDSLEIIFVVHALFLTVVLFINFWGFLLLLALDILVGKLTISNLSKEESLKQELAERGKIYLIRKYKIKLLSWYTAVLGVLLVISISQYLSSDYYARSRFQDSIDRLVEDKDSQKLQAQMEILKDANWKGEENRQNFAYFIDQILKKDPTLITGYIESSISNFSPETLELLAAAYKKNGIRFSSISNLLEMSVTENGGTHSEYVELLKTHPKSLVIDALEKQIISYIQNSNENTNFYLINSKIFFLKQNFGTTNDKVFNQLGAIFWNLSNLSKSRKPYVYEPSKPEYTKPEYTGCFYMTAEYAGPFQGGGVVLKAGGKYYLVENGIESRNPFTKYYYGYYEKTGETITLSRGRNGTPCEVLKLRDEETYWEDQKDYERKVQDAQEEYSSNLAEYQDKLAEYKKDAAQNGAQNAAISKQINEKLSLAKGLILQL